MFDLLLIPPPILRVRRWAGPFPISVDQCRRYAEKILCRTLSSSFFSPPRLPPLRFPPLLSRTRYGTTMLSTVASMSLCKTLDLIECERWLLICKADCPGTERARRITLPRPPPFNNETWRQEFFFSLFFYYYLSSSFLKHFIFFFILL